MKKVSLVLTTFNSAELLPGTLAGIEKQNYPDLEVNIKDGGSDDGTIEIIRQYAADTRHEVNWISTPDSGIYDAMNQGYQLATGDVLVFFNDLFLAEDAVSEMIALLESSPGSVGVHADLIYATDRRIVRYWRMGPQRSLYAGWMPGHPTLFLKREIYEKYGLYNVSYKIAADYEFMIRFLKDKENKLAYLPKTIIRMYYGGTSTSGTGSYLLSLREGHRALKENGMKGAAVIDILRTLRVLLQFVIKNRRNEEKQL